MTWNERKAKAVAELRTAYMAEVERLAESLRPRFEAGELYGYRDENEGRDTDYSGMHQLEAAASAHFGLQVTETTSEESGWVTYEGDGTGSYLVLAASPSTDLMGRMYDGATANHPAHDAVSAIVLDLIALARERRWYRARPDESPSAEELATRKAA